MRSVETDDVVHGGILSRWVGWGPEPPGDQSASAVWQLAGSSA